MVALTFLYRRRAKSGGGKRRGLAGESLSKAIGVNDGTNCRMFLVPW
jgi:hypothetical protein